MINLFKSFFARIGTFVINTAKKVGKFFKDHYNPLNDPYSDDQDYSDLHAVYTLAVFVSIPFDWFLNTNPITLRITGVFYLVTGLIGLIQEYYRHKCLTERSELV